MNRLYLLASWLTTLRSIRISLAAERKQFLTTQVVDIQVREDVILGDEATAVECADECQPGLMQRHRGAGDPAEFDQRYDTERNVFGHISMFEGRRTWWRAVSPDVLLGSHLSDRPQRESEG